MSSGIKFVLLLTPFKVGSCYVSSILRENGVQHARVHAYDPDEQAKFPEEKITHVITVERENMTDLYISAFYNDMHHGVQHYPYAFSDNMDDCLNASVAELVEHFRKQDFKSCRWLNYDYYRAMARRFERRDIPVLTLQTEKLSLLESHQQIADFLGFTGGVIQALAGIDKALPHAAGPVWLFNPAATHKTSEKKDIGDRYLAFKTAVYAAGNNE